MEIKTKRLILRKLKKTDWADIVEGAGEYDVARMTATIPHPYGKKDAKWFINDSLLRWAKKKDYIFCIELKLERKLIGVMSLLAVNQFNGTATTGSWINKNYWRKGYITEAKIAVNDFAFNKLKLRRLNSTVRTDNKASNATQKKMGYVLEGVERRGQRSKANGKIHDINVYGLLKEDWKKVRPRLIKSIKLVSG